MKHIGRMLGRLGSTWSERSGNCNMRTADGREGEAQQVTCCSLVKPKLQTVSAIGGIV